MQQRRKVKKETGMEVPRVRFDYHFMSQEDEKACKNPVMIMIDEQTGEKYARATGKKGVGVDGELDWLIKDMSDEWKTWGHQGGTGGCLIAKCDNENSILVVRDKVAKYHGGKVIP